MPIDREPLYAKTEQFVAGHPVTPRQIGDDHRACIKVAVDVVTANYARAARAIGPEAVAVLAAIEARMGALPL